MPLANPASLTDSELLEDLEAAKRMSSGILSSDKVSYSVKKEYAQHVRDLIQEQEKRTNQEYMYPLSSFGIVDFL